MPWATSSPISTATWPPRSATARVPSYLSAYRYDPYGQTLDTYSAANPVPVPFRYQGRILQSAEGATDLV